MSNLVFKSLLLAALALLYSCGLPEKIAISPTRHANRIYLWDAKEKYQEELAGFMSEHNLTIEVYNQGNTVVISVYADKTLTEQLNKRFKEAGICTTTDFDP